jgi:hypothetical protein
MTIGSLVAQLGPSDMIRESEMGEFLPLQMAVIPGSTARGIAYPPGPTVGANKATGWLAIFTLPPGLTYTTGLTFYLLTTDDGTFAADLGNTTVFGVAVKKCTAAAPTGTTGTEATATITMSATSGVFVQTAIAIANANLNSAGAGDTVCVRIRRIATSTSDLVLGRVIVPTVHVTDT